MLKLIKTNILRSSLYIYIYFNNLIFQGTTNYYMEKNSVKS